MKKDVKFEEVLLSLGQEMTNLLVKRGSSFEDAEDAVSQTYLTIFSILPEITQDNLRPWFFRVSFNNYINIYRKKRREQGFVHNYHVFQSDFSEEHSKLFELIDSLTAAEQELILLKYFYQLSYSDISDLLGISIENVRKKLYRSRKKLKKSLED
ncbi:RNA polymerase sigma factor [Enterococcus sp. AZ072]|uniref:RNA polymerase sigma factor n=1 Tax=unclassified Enterococcus TaxID=2608891 RepID=UPI003D2CEDC2